MILRLTMTIVRMTRLDAVHAAVVFRHLPLPQADAKSKQQQEAAIEQLLEELDIDLLVLARWAPGRQTALIKSVSMGTRG